MLKRILVMAACLLVASLSYAGGDCYDCLERLRQCNETRCIDCWQIPDEPCEVCPSCENPPPRVPDYCETFQDRGGGWVVRCNPPTPAPELEIITERVIERVEVSQPNRLVLDLGFPEIGTFSAHPYFLPHDPYWQAKHPDAVRVETFDRSRTQASLTYLRDVKRRGVVGGGVACLESIDCYLKVSGGVRW